MAILKKRCTTCWWRSFCKEVMHTHRFKPEYKIFGWTDRRGDKVRAFESASFKGVFSQSGAWDPKKVEAPNPLWGWKDLTLFNWRQQSDLTFGKDLRMIHHHTVISEVLIAEFSEAVYKGEKNWTEQSIFHTPLRRLSPPAGLGHVL